MCIYERDFAQNNAVLKRKENEYGKELFEFEVTKISLPIQANSGGSNRSKNQNKNKSQNSSTNSSKNANDEY